MSVYWTFQTVTTVGFGDMPWGNKVLSEYVLSLMWMIFGVAVYSFSVGSVSSMIAASDTKAAILS